MSVVFNELTRNFKHARLFWLKRFGDEKLIHVLTELNMKNNTCVFTTDLVVVAFIIVFTSSRVTDIFL